jgi:glycosyltransferase involved in cell wall biosynthesis
MGKTKKKPKVKIYPFVSICTPTFNRRPFIPIMFECFRNQTYPKDRMEWIIVDDGTDKIQDLIDNSEIHQIKYFPLKDKMTLGAKRNFMHSKTSGSIIVYMDDDDYYPPERVSHAVDVLQQNRNALCCGSSELYVYFKHINSMYQMGPYGPNHATAGTFAFRKELLNITKYNETASLAEEREFLHEYTIPFAQLNPLKTILVFSHNHNTFDKKKLLENPNPQFTKVSEKTVDHFIKFEYENKIKEFFLNKIDSLLENYKPGSPHMKPDVLKQIAEIEENRKKMMQQNINTEGKKVMVKIPGKENPEELTPETAMMLLNSQSQEMAKMKNYIMDLENTIKKLQNEIQQLS